MDRNRILNLHQHRSVEPTRAVNLLMDSCCRYGDVKSDEGGKILSSHQLRPSSQTGAAATRSRSLCLCVCIIFSRNY